MCEGFHRGDFHELVDTLMHEGWHAVQHQCRQGAPLLSEQEIASRISHEDALNVHNYHPKQQHLESEARVIAKMNDQIRIGSAWSKTNVVARVKSPSLQILDFLTSPFRSSPLRPGSHQLLAF